MIPVERLLSVLKAPLISEKATNNAEGSNTVVFKVALDANKVEIASAVAQLFEVKVDSVRTVVVKGKTKRRGAKVGRRSDWKKAYVTLQEGQSLDFAEGATE
ncbi:50S ribosomal protein L23 [Lonepinella koalarum]|uniref:Large ribosomal subunit protein uL23 n=1 Tax=Lonepinella koalarum TaxID=53417 RepID=A0A4R1L2U5_9PAST|nr:50S ribosomal protein L23 [Lonepinella koalarum]MDH2926159.1 50S ribosomal protein L23 [Lonepinella koalarum]TCK71310.1 LSU ribosomal protein L23P [Lonepinella koalarum]TFJ91028.1 50S ribosomal protein L23 [Lonepinella koalarum]TYG34846.1 50S ribosomal protein L23 [Lonepinella koalarum]